MLLLSGRLGLNEDDQRDETYTLREELSTIVFRSEEGGSYILTITPGRDGAVAFLHRRRQELASKKTLKPLPVRNKLGIYRLIDFYLKSTHFGRSCQKLFSGRSRSVA